MGTFTGALHRLLQGYWSLKENIVYTIAPPTASLRDSDSALGNYFRRRRARHGTSKAIAITAHKLARLFCFMLKHCSEYVDIGAEEEEAHYRQRALCRLKRQAHRLGVEVVG